MRGRILGYDPSAGTGAISGENGERFAFTVADWRTDRPIAAGMSVDFAATGSAATEIYPMANAMPAAADLAASPAVQKARTLAFTTLGFPLAALLLLATFLPAISTPMKSVSLWGIGGLSRMISANPLLGNDDVASVAEDIQRLDQEAQDLRTHTTGFGGMPVDNSAELAAVAKARAHAEHAMSAARWAATVKTLLVVRWAVPVLAALLLWLTWGGKESKAATLATGAAGILTALILWLYRGSLVGGGDEDSIGGAIAARMDEAISLGIGTWLIGLLGIGLLLAGLGIIRNPLAARAR